MFLMSSWFIFRRKSVKKNQKWQIYRFNTKLYTRRRYKTMQRTETKILSFRLASFPSWNYIPRSRRIIFYFPSKWIPLRLMNKIRCFIMKIIEVKAYWGPSREYKGYKRRSIWVDHGVCRVAVRWHVQTHNYHI